MIKETSHKPFLAAYFLLKTLREEGKAQNASILLNEFGNSILMLGIRDYQLCKDLAERLMQNTTWYVDTYGCYCLTSNDALTREDD